MSQKVLVFAGTKQSGKSTSAKFIHGYRMREAGAIKWFDVSEEGELLVNAYFTDANGNKVETNNAILDIYRQDFDFAQYANEAIWPFAKVYSFASELKDSAIRIFGLNPQYIYGSDEDKNQPSTIMWPHIWTLLDEERQEEIKDKYNNDISSRYLSHREVLQEFGTVCRKFYAPCWIQACFTRIKEEGYPFCIIDDCRYENEVDYATKEGAFLVLLDRQPFKNDTHSSEKIHSVDRKKFNYIIPEVSMKEKNEELVKVLQLAGWTTPQIG